MKIHRKDYNRSLSFLVVYVFLMLIPGELYFYIAGVRLEFYRLYLLVMAVVLFGSIVAFNKMTWIERFLFLYCVYAGLGFLYNHGFSGVKSAVILFVEVFVSYSLGLLMGGKRKSLNKFLLLFSFVYILLIPFAVLETIDGYRVLHVLAASVAGNPVMDYLGDSYFRYGIHRAGTVFSHPILYSVCAVMLLPLIFASYKKVKAGLLSIGVFVAMVTSVTSAGFLMLAFQFGFYFLNLISIKIKNIFKYTAYVSIFSFLCLNVVSNRGAVLLFIQTLSLNPATAYTRYQQWQFSFDDILANPIWGIGFNEWSRPHWMSFSVDSFWLMTILQNGFIALLFLSCFFVGSCIVYWKAWRVSGDIIHFSFFVSIFSVIFAAFTVDFFDRAQLMVFMFMGIYNSFSYKILRDESFRKRASVHEIA